MFQLIEHLQNSGILRSSLLIDALKDVDRSDFVPDDLRDRAYEDTALPIGEGQTISQPYTVVFMLEQLQAEKGNRVLEAGYGSAWQTALLAHIVGEHGIVYAFEVLPSLANFGKEILNKYPELAKRVVLFAKSGEHGAPKATSLDRIICGAEVSAVPRAWREQLKIGGRMIYPYKQGIVVEVKKANGDFEAESFPGFVFVPFVNTA